MVEKDNYATTSPLNEGAGATNNYISDTPFGNVKIYDLDAEIQPIERMQIVPNVQNLPPVTQEVATETTTIAPITPDNKPNYLLYGGGALVVGLVAYLAFKKK